MIFQVLLEIKTRMQYTRGNRIHKNSLFFLTKAFACTFIVLNNCYQISQLKMFTLNFVALRNFIITWETCFFLEFLKAVQFMFTQLEKWNKIWIEKWFLNVESQQIVSNIFENIEIVAKRLFLMKLLPQNSVSASFWRTLTLTFVYFARRLILIVQNESVPKSFKTFFNQTVKMSSSRRFFRVIL